MNTKRRDFLQAILPGCAAVVCAPAGLGLAARIAPPQQGQQPPQHLPPQPTPPAEGLPSGVPHTPHHHDLSDSMDPPKPDPATVLRHNQAEIETDVKKLYALAGQLKDELEKSNSTKVLSASAVSDTKAIEKLAKHIRSLLTPV